MNLAKARQLAHHDRDGSPLNPLQSPPPTPEEALEIINDSLKRRGHQWLTGEAARDFLEAHCKKT
jgi:hypothetical protein